VTLAEAIAARDEALTWGGRDGVTHLLALESAPARACSGYHRPSWRKAAAWLESMMGKHGFANGNKRMAWLPVEVPIARSGDLLEVDDGPADDRGAAVASGEPAFDGLAAGFRLRLRRG
tara:strand:- start:425 stop:781 length:357 start_codon:yes stop_codon:yes gene_type:complete